MWPDDVARLEALKKEKAKMKSPLTERDFDNDMPREVTKGRMVTPGCRRAGAEQLQLRVKVCERRACAMLGQLRGFTRSAPINSR